MSADLLPQALVAVGMATVFVLFAVLIAALAVMSRLVHPRRRSAQILAAPQGSDARAEMASTVVAAIRHHRVRGAEALP